MISVITASYNRAITLPRALDSLLGQTCADWECVLVDDGSSDGTAALLDSYHDPRIRVITHQGNRGVCAAKNTGLDNVRGEWVTFLDSDDELLPQALETVLDVAARTGATSVLTNCRDSVTGQMTGIGPSHEGWLTPKESAALGGDHWGINQTSLIGDLRFSERLHTVGRIVWVPLHLRVHRYYIDQALRIYHSEGSDQVTKRRLSLRERVDMSRVLSEETGYLEALRELDRADYQRTMRRIWVAKFLDPFVPQDP